MIEETIMRINVPLETDFEDVVTDEPTNGELAEIALEELNITRSDIDLATLIEEETYYLGS